MREPISKRNEGGGKRKGMHLVHEPPFLLVGVLRVEEGGERGGGGESAVLS